MATFQTVFARVEKKYFLNPDQYRNFTQVLRLHGFKRIDYPDPTTCSIYFDTDEFTLVKRSIERPNYKEKLRLRTYGHCAVNESVAFPEIKKKYDGIVYKRRVEMNYEDAYECLASGLFPESTGQIGKEISFFFERYPTIKPKAIIAYERETWQAPDGVDLRVTFDSSIRFRDEDLDLRHGSDGHLLIERDMRLMELKLPMVFPLWITDSLWGLGIHQAHFSKYGEGYTRYIASHTKSFPTQMKEVHFVA